MSRRGVTSSPVEQPVDDANNNGKVIARIPSDVNGRARHPESSNPAAGKCIMDESSSSDNDDDHPLRSPGKIPEPTSLCLNDEIEFYGPIVIHGDPNEL